MTKGPRKTDAAQSRDARLRAALRANLARRKAQGRARAGAAEEGSPPDEQQGQATPNGAAQNEARDNEAP
ncbi:MAG: hypothetical protein QM682_12875 [Paracoccus sp. (in: a-proteobacteria)]|uniref:hypothetical protein n=1 Tax=Paracoccus sp. TaxID=267 RepID=UPI0039E59A9D